MCPCRELDDRQEVLVSQGISWYTMNSHCHPHKFKLYPFQSNLPNFKAIFPIPAIKPIFSFPTSTREGVHYFCKKVPSYTSDRFLNTSLSSIPSSPYSWRLFTSSCSISFLWSSWSSLSSFSITSSSSGISLVASSSSPFSLLLPLSLETASLSSSSSVWSSCS